MGKRLIQQRRGRAKGRYNAPSHKYKGKAKYSKRSENFEGVITDIFHDPGHTAPLAEIQTDKGDKIVILAFEGVKVGDKMSFTNNKDKLSVGNVLPLKMIPEGAPVYNVEIKPGDGGKLVRAGGGNAVLVSQDKNSTVIQLPSGKFKKIDSSCRATVGIVAGGGRKDKPFLKAGKKYHTLRARGRIFPVVRGVAMNPVSHPHGGGGHQHVGKPSTVKRGASPGRKVGSIAAKKTGRK